MIQVFCVSEKTAIVTNDVRDRGSIPLIQDTMITKDTQFWIRRFSMVKIIINVNVKIKKMVLVSASLLLGAGVFPVQPKIAFNENFL